MKCVRIVCPWDTSSSSSILFFLSIYASHNFLWVKIQQNFYSERKIPNMKINTEKERERENTHRLLYSYRSVCVRCSFLVCNYSLHSKWIEKKSSLFKRRAQPKRLLVIWCAFPYLIQTNTTIHIWGLWLFVSRFLCRCGQKNICFSFINPEPTKTENKKSTQTT